MVFFCPLGFCKDEEFTRDRMVDYSRVYRALSSARLQQTMEYIKKSIRKVISGLHEGIPATEGSEFCYNSLLLSF